MLKLKNSAMLVVAGLCGYVALMTPDWKSDLVAKIGVAYKNNYEYSATKLTGDVLFLNTSTGATQIWEGASTTTVRFPGAYNNSIYVYAGTGNFYTKKNDGSAAIMWYRPANGQIQIWEKGVKTNSHFPGNGNTGFVPVAACPPSGRFRVAGLRMAGASRLGK